LKLIHPCFCLFQELLKINKVKETLDFITNIMRYIEAFEGKLLQKLLSLKTFGPRQGLNCLGQTLNRLVNINFRGQHANAQPNCRSSKFMGQSGGCQNA
jgi:hypothetical protein